MRIALIGYGKMGRMIEQVALARGHEIAAIVDPVLGKTFADINPANIDAAIEFSRPDAAVDNIIALAQRKIPTVVGTTAWQNRMDEVRKAVEDAGSSLLWASNFSIGVNIFYRVAWYAAEMFNKITEYDVGGFEAHHNKKLDSPSGTAKTLAEGVLSRISRKKKIVWETLAEQKPNDDELHFPSLRMGNVPGTHSLFFDSAVDTIEITHTARSREGFALGAVQAAAWLTAEKRQGIYTIDDMLKDI
ncbi:MAG: 4-hydroxy-tetrahydrodipicolinate reductase [Treponema sp.]|jgi:4-hydroxy-tetrahydrodipicolinate reductase|nr:4-hydroxy-tetrahydrodipicolinate reductase [Treponema sp.]